MSKNNRDPKYSGWPGPEPVEPVQTDIEDAVAEAPPVRKPRKAKDAAE
jgi:hypothetical protein